MRYEAFLFDMDGVITDTNDQHFTAWKELAKEINIEIDLKFNENLKGISRKESLNRILKYGNREKDFNEEEKNRMMTKKNNLYLSLINGFTPDNLYKGILELLKKLKSKKVKIVLTSASKNAPYLLKKMEIDYLFDGIVDPGTVQGKPNPDIFLKGAQIAGVSPGKCIAVEDAQSGIDAINAAGITSIAIGHHLKGADIYYKNAKEILENLDKII